MNRQALKQKVDQLSQAQYARLKDQILQRPKTTGNDVIASILDQAGITHVYGIAGVPIDELMGHCAAVGMRIIGTRHQQGAALAAAAQNYVTGRLVTVVVVSSGPAMTNTLTGVQVAKENAWPLLVIGGGADKGPGQFHEMDSAALFEPVTKAIVQIRNARSITSILLEAAQETMRGRPGPVFVEIDRNIFFGPAQFSDSIEFKPWIAPKPDGEKIAQAAALLRNAKRPILVIGKGLRWSFPDKALRNLTARGIPFIASPMGQGYLPDDAAENVSFAGSMALSSADVIVSVGMRWNWTFRFGAELSAGAKLVQVDIHEPEIGRNLAPAVGIAGDAKAVLDALTEALGTIDWRSNPFTQDWFLQLAETRNAQKIRWQSKIDSTKTTLDFQTLFSVLAEVLPKDAVTILDGNYTLEAGKRLLPCHKPASRLTPGTNGCMGTSVPFALGAKLANPGQVVVAVTGDLAFGMSAMELETLIRHQIPVIIIVTNNQGNRGAETQKRCFGDNHPERVSMFVPKAQYESLSTAFGGMGFCIETIEAFRAAVKEALNSDRVACINALLDPDEPSPLTWDSHSH